MGRGKRLAPIRNWLKPVAHQALLRCLPGGRMAATTPPSTGCMCLTCPTCTGSQTHTKGWGHSTGHRARARRGARSGWDGVSPSSKPPAPVPLLPETHRTQIQREIKNFKMHHSALNSTHRVLWSAGSCSTALVV